MTAREPDTDDANEAVGPMTAGQPAEDLESLDVLIDQISGLTWDDELVAYRCSNCDERCINPPESQLAIAGVCFGCHLDYLSDRMRAIRRREIDG